MLIEELEFSVRTYNCLKRAKIDTVEQLQSISDDELMKIRCFGQSCLQEVRRKFPLPCKTNFDRVLSMDYEELAKFIAPESPGNRVWCDPIGKTKCGKAPCKKCVLEWLQQPADEVQ